MPIRVPRRRPGLVGFFLSVATIVVVLTICGSYYAHSFRVFKYWSYRHECEAKMKPLWPFALQKYSDQTLETKGRVASNFQNLGHKCGRFGADTKCHRCEKIKCGDSFEQECDMQIHGMNYSNLPKNIPTSTEVPWAISETRGNIFKLAVPMFNHCPRID